MDQNLAMATTAGETTETRGAALLVLASIVSVQCGAALATTLFDEIGAVGGGLPARRLRRPGAGGGDAGGGAAGARVAAPGRLPARRRGRRRQPLLLRRAGTAAAGNHGHARVRRPARGGDRRLAPARATSSGRCWPRRNRSSLRRRRAARAVDALGVVLALTAGAFWAAYIVLSDRVGSLGPGAGRSDDGGGDLGPAGGAARARPGRRRDLRPLAPGDRRRGRRPQHRRFPTSSRSRRCDACRGRSSGC